MKKPTLKMINELKDSTNVSLLDRITERFKHSRINYKKHIWHKGAIIGSCWIAFGLCKAEAIRTSY